MKYKNNKTLMQDDEHNESKSTNDTEIVNDTNDFLEMKRRFTLVTAEEPIPPGEDDLKQHLPIIDKELPADGTRSIHFLLFFRFLL